MPDVKRHFFYTRYRLMNRPNDDVDVFDVVPIFPAENGGLRGKRFIHDYHREIAWSIDYRGDDDDVPTLVFVGAGYTLIKKVFMQMFGKASYCFKGFRLYRDTYIRPRHNKAWWRVAVELKDLDTSIISISDLGNIIQRRIQRECLCNIKYVSLDKFLNL